jgi:hypothetical protein
MNEPNKQKDNQQEPPSVNSDVKTEEKPNEVNPAHWNLQGNIIIEDNDGDPD